ncbi:MAG: hypothetical protein ACK40O_11390 [Allosphingosinicella sp.]
MKTIFASLAAVALTAAAPAGASSGTKSDAAQTQEAEAPKAEKKICKTYENTASRMKATKLCLTKAEWKKFDRMD